MFLSENLLNILLKMVENGQKSALTSFRVQVAPKSKSKYTTQPLKTKFGGYKNGWGQSRQLGKRAKNMENGDLNQQLGCAAPKRWSRYTAHYTCVLF